MVIDSSAIVSIVFSEPGAEAIAQAITEDSVRLMSSVNWLETMMVAESRMGPEFADNALLILSELAVEVVPFDAEQMRESRRAWRRFGKGKHPAGLNMSDCCSTRFTRAAEMLGVRPGLGASFSRPAIPKARNRFRQRATFCAVIPNSAAMSLSCFPAAASNTMRARSTRRTDRDPARAHCSSASCCSGVRSIGRATRIGRTSPL